MLQVQSLACERGQRRLFEGLAFTLAPREILHIRGGNGTGKTTLLKALLGFYTEYEGQIEWRLDEPPAYVSHAAGLSDNLTVAENLHWYAELCGQRLSSEDLARALAALGLEGMGHRLGSTLSQGQKKRANLARLLVAPRTCWVLDEPASALDADGITILHGLLRRHRDGGGGIIITSHQPLDLEGVKTLALGALEPRA